MELNQELISNGANKADTSTNAKGLFTKDGELDLLSPKLLNQSPAVLVSLLSGHNIKSGISEEHQNQVDRSNLDFLDGLTRRSLPPNPAGARAVSSLAALPQTSHECRPNPSSSNASGPSKGGPPKRPQSAGPSIFMLSKIASQLTPMNQFPEKRNVSGSSAATTLSDVVFGAAAAQLVANLQAGDLLALCPVAYDRAVRQLNATQSFIKNLELKLNKAAKTVEQDECDVLVRAGTDQVIGL
ncbi:hypothetical protein MJO28_004702 [Puccinia striiformis f. sp. tritici]|uniref:Uncharacterized protein n=1 Tax=Puccinia striiformis f. sp. tritici TaxID=168172 RepID=A0ACC0EHZ7_9BASI|nr:hypothetical protein MJO28_004702 [Puccinia striiformis f. sp. tritici]